MENETEIRLMALETKFTFLEDFVEKLQQASVEQAEEIQRLKAENKILSQKIQAALSRKQEGMNFSLGQEF